MLHVGYTYSGPKTLMNPRRLYMVLLGTSGIVVCLTLLSLSANDHLAHPSLRSALSLDQFPLTPHSSPSNASYRDFLASIRPSDAQSHSRTLGVASHIFVLSLPRRVDRRRSMDSLARALDLHFEYIDGLEATNPNVDHALNTLKRERKAFKKKYARKHGGSLFPGFAFPGFNEHDDTKGNANSDAWFNGTDPLASSSSSLLDVATSTPSSIRTDGHAGRIKDIPISCATPEDPFPDMLSESEIKFLPPWRILSRGMVACWMGHLGIIHRLATQQDENAVAIILEDDVDMEFDIERRLRRLWPALPHGGWDMIMLGYCHSDEIAHPPLAGTASIRPSFAPKCTHAYALSRVGARRLFQILTTPGFAYSRALDQAISWLIQTNEIRSYSIVPAVIVQRKLSRSDIWRPHAPGTGGDTWSGRGSEKGSKWRDALVDSTLERVEMVASELGMAANG